MLIWRQYAPLVFLNARVLSNELRTLALGREDIRVVVLDATASSGIDTTAASAFIAASHDLAAEGIALWVVNVREAGWKMVVAALNAAGAAIPPVFESLTDAVARFEHEQRQNHADDDTWHDVERKHPDEGRHSNHELVAAYRPQSAEVAEIGDPSQRNDDDGGEATESEIGKDGQQE